MSAADRSTPYNQAGWEPEQQEQPRAYLVTDGLKSQATRETYQIGFNQFLKHANNDLRTLLDTKQDILESKIISFIEYLRDTKELKYWSIQVYCAAILHFFEMNDVRLNTKKIKRFLPADEGHYNQDRPYTIDEIARILDKCDIRSRVIVLLMASTGMRVGGLSGLRISDIQKMDEFGLYLIWVYSGSKKDRYYTFTTPECATAIDAYLDYRQKFGEVIKDRSPLIRNMVAIDNQFTTQTPRFVSVRAIEKIVEELVKQAGFYHLTNGKQKQVMRTHGFRKWYANQCSRSHVDYPTREYLIGDKLPCQESSYNRMTEEDRLVEYTKAIPLLTIHSESRLKQQIQELQSNHLQNIEELKNKVMTELKEEYKLISKKEWETMKVEMKAIKESILLEFYEATGKPVHLDANYSDDDDDDDNDE